MDFCNNGIVRGLSSPFRFLAALRENGVRGSRVPLDRYYNNVTSEEFLGSLTIDRLTTRVNCMRRAITAGIDYMPRPLIRHILSFLPFTELPVSSRIAEIGAVIQDHGLSAEEQARRRQGRRWTVGRFFPEQQVVKFIMTDPLPTSLPRPTPPPPPSP